MGYLLLHRLNRIIQACQKQEACRKVVERDPAETTLHHIALNIALEDFESEKMRLEGLGLKVDATVHEWLHVRSLYFPDPERCPEPVEGGESAGVRLLRCKRGIGEMLACTLRYGWLGLRRGYLCAHPNINVITLSILL